MEVRREDQEKINRFSSLHQKETALEEELRGKIVSNCSIGDHVGKGDAWHTYLRWEMVWMIASLANEVFCAQKEKEDLEEISGELELVDEEEKVPYVFPQTRSLGYRDACVDSIYIDTKSVTASSHCHSQRCSSSSSRRQRQLMPT